MEHIVTFMLANWYLFAGFLLVLALLIHTETRAVQQGIELITPEILVQRMNKDQAIVVDIRDAKAYAKGHILGALNLSIDKAVKAPKLTNRKAKPVIVVDQNGMQAVKAAQGLKQAEFTQVSVLKGGLNAWNEANLPLSKN